MNVQTHTESYYFKIQKQSTIYKLNNFQLFNIQFQIKCQRDKYVFSFTNDTKTF